MEQPLCYRVSLWIDGRWRPRVTRTRDPMKLIRYYEKQGWDRRLILVERRPGKYVPMPKPIGPTPVVMAGWVVSA